jgi:formylglycine-generating enzyme required for sulfatase activity
LPTGAEWEFGCRAGTSTSRFLGDDDSAVTDYDWFNRNSDDHLWPVGLKKPNPWGLFDLYGNCCEWCHDAPLSMDLHRTATSGRTDRTEPVNDDVRRIRGGTYRSTFRELNSAFSDTGTRLQRLSFFGFRVAKTVE